MKTTIKNGFLLLALSLLASCDSLPDAYQGVFWNKAAGVRVTLHSYSADVEFKGREKVNHKAEEFNFETASAGRNGIFVRKNSQNKNLVDVYYIIPKRATKKSEFNFVWFEAELLYTQLDTTKKAAVKDVSVVRCLKGTVMLDWTTKDFELGCPADAQTITLTRVKTSSNSSGGFNPFQMP